MKAILALDTATRTGWAIARAGADGWRLVESGVQVFDLRRGESPGLRFMRFRAWLGELRRMAGPFDLVAYELAHHRGGPATVLAVGFTTRVDEWAAENGIEHAAVHSATLKKASAGSGRAEKPLMIAAARTRWNVQPIDDNHADALCLLAYAIDTYSGARTAPQQEARF